MFCTFQHYTNVYMYVLSSIVYLTKYFTNVSVLNALDANSFNTFHHWKPIIQNYVQCIYLHIVHKLTFVTRFAKREGLINMPFRDPSFVTSALTIHVCKSCTVCLCWGWFTSRVVHPQVFWLSVMGSADCWWSWTWL